MMICDILMGVERCISAEDNSFLTSIYMEKEVITTLKEMGPMKASRCDGFPVIFFQQCWYIVGREVSNYCLGVLNDNLELEPMNNKILYLSPKFLTLPI